MTNYQNYKKKTKLERIHKELNEELEEVEANNPEAGADLRWSLISLLRAISGLKKG